MTEDGAKASKLLETELPGNQLFQKYLATRATKGRELEIKTVPEDYVGFVTGLDHEWVQLCLTGKDDDLTATIIQVGHITGIKETGRTLRDLPNQDVDRITTYGSVYSMVANNELARKKAAS